MMTQPDFNRVLRVGTRDSALALHQTSTVIAALQSAWPQLAIETIPMKTLGDKFLQAPFHALGVGTGVFVKELEHALLNDAIDLAVHSMKDLPGHGAEGLTVAAVGDREDPRDVWIAHGGASLMAMPAGMTVGTASLRRVAQLKRLRPDLKYVSLRGNLQTRWQKLTSGEVDAMVLAAAGIHRLGWQDRITDYFDATVEGLLPAVNQGILGAQYRQDDTWVTTLLVPLERPLVGVACRAERALLRMLEGGCQVPMGAYANLEGADRFRLEAALYSLDGQQVVSSSRVFSVQEDVEGAGRQLAEWILTNGGSEIRQTIRDQLNTPEVGAPQPPAP
jgi:hydroxymethylbilane synthase